MLEFYFQNTWCVRGGNGRLREASRVTGIYGASGLECVAMLISRLITPLTAAIVAVLILSQAAHADLLIKIDKSTQRMTVTVGGEQLYDWPVSTGGRGYDTPSGTFKPFPVWTSTTTARSGTMRRCLIRYSSPRPAMPCTAPTSSAISAVRCRRAAFDCR
jgi:hypothetical protein